MLIILFVLGAVGMRFLPHAWNFTPVVGMLLLVGCYMKAKQLWIPIAALVASDFALNIWVYRTPGGVDQYLTWGAWLVVLGLALLALKNRVKVTRLLGTTVAASTLFFLISNFGVWLGGTLYPRTLAGLGTCYFMGLPFYRSAALGDLLYTAAFFGLYSLAEHRLQARAAAAA
ncbi:MAG TPA: DUF6580 family putative transport protein [Terriglobales bacterium]|nr:DUF6580 family putative transport protein [Terriglobales bacterium]